MGSLQPLAYLETEDWEANVYPSPRKCKQDPLWGVALGLNLQQMLRYLQAFPLLHFPCPSDSSFPLGSLLDHRCAGNTWCWVLSEAPAQVTVTLCPLPVLHPPPALSPLQLRGSLQLFQLCQSQEQCELHSSSWCMPGRLWFSSDEVKQELWKSPNESSRSRSRAGDLSEIPPG